MGGKGEVKTRKILSFLTWLGNHKGVEIKKGGRHQIKVIIIHNNDSCPLPTSHPIVKGPIIESFREFLIKNEICTEEEFDERVY